MNPTSDHPISFKQTVLATLTSYSHKAAALGRQVRQLVFGFRQRSTAHIDRWALPVKLIHDHHVPQRRRAFKQAGGLQSSVALRALEKARQDK
jgi:hypothetical protein